MIFLALACVFFKVLFSFDREGNVHEVFAAIYIYSDVGILVGAVGELVRRKPSARVAGIAAPVAGLIGVVLIGNVFNGVGFSDSAASAIRWVLPYIFFSALLAAAGDPRSERVVSNFARFFVFVLPVLIVFGIAFFDQSMNRDEVWLPNYFSGLHTSSYLLIAVVLTVFVLHVQRGRGRSIYLFPYFAFALYMLYFGWGVRTALLAVLVFAGSYWIPRSRYKGAVFFAFMIFGVLAVGYGFEYVNYSSFVDLDLYTSGRLSMYGEKLSYLANYSVVDWLIGRGAGSDLMLSDIWWWEEKGSHNDFLTMVVEYGLVFFGLYVFLLYRLYRLSDDRAYRAALVAIVMTSVVSNGYLSRPLAFYVAMMPLALLVFGSIWRKKAVAS